MVILSLYKENAKMQLEKFCEERIPPHLRDKIKISYKIKGDTFTLYECRPIFNDPIHWTEMSVAQIRYKKDEATWYLYWPNRNGKWFPYDDLHMIKNFADIIKELEDDPTGAFWG